MNKKAVKQVAQQMKLGLLRLLFVLIYVIGFYATVTFVFSFGGMTATIGALLILILGVAYAYEIFYQFYRLASKVAGKIKKDKSTKAGVFNLYE